MKAIDFYKFINENDIEFRWLDNPATSDRDVIFSPSIYHIKEFNELISIDNFHEEGVVCLMKDRYFAIWASDVLPPHGIKLTEIFGEDAD